MTQPKAPVAAWENRIVGYDDVAPDQLLANPRNWRIHPRFQQAALAAALDAVGWVQPVLVNQRSGHVIDGHLRIALALREERATVPVLYVDLSDEQERLVLLTLDPLAGLAVDDPRLLGDLLADVGPIDGALGTFLDGLAATITPAPPDSPIFQAPAATAPICPRCGYVLPMTPDPTDKG